MESFYDSRKTCEEILNQPFLGIPMKTNTLGTTLLVIGAILGMSAWMLHDRGEIALPDSPPKNQNTIVLTNTGTSSGTTQVVNSGVTDFHTPNLEWKSRDVTLADGRTLHYVFGEGNPKEVGLTEEEKEKNARPRHPVRELIVAAQEIFSLLRYFPVKPVRYSMVE